MVDSNRPRREEMLFIHQSINARTMTCKADPGPSTAVHFSKSARKLAGAAGSGESSSGVRRRRWIPSMQKLFSTCENSWKVDVIPLLAPLAIIRFISGLLKNWIEAVT